MGENLTNLWKMKNKVLNIGLRKRTEVHATFKSLRRLHIIKAYTFVFYYDYIALLYMIIMGIYSNIHGNMSYEG